MSRGAQRLEERGTPGWVSSSGYGAKSCTPPILWEPVPRGLRPRGASFVWFRFQRRSGQSRAIDSGPISPGIVIAMWGLRVRCAVPSN